MELQSARELRRSQKAIAHALETISSALGSLSPLRGNGVLKIAEHDPEKKHRELYCIYRDYLKHEDDLINNRLNWNFTIQGFLFAVYTFSLQKIADMKVALLSSYVMPERVATLNITHTLYDLQLLLAAIAVVGIGVSFFVYLSVYAARLAITQLVIHWHEINKDSGWPKPAITLGLLEYIRAILHKETRHGPDLCGLPGLVGGGNPAANMMGFHAPSGLPLLFIAVWVFLLVDACRELSG